MGVLILLCGVAGLGVSGLLGLLGFALQRKAMTEAGSWLAFWLIAAVISAVVIGLGVMCLLRGQGSPPKPEDYSNVMKGLFLLGAAPGTGMLAAALTSFATR